MMATPVDHVAEARMHIHWAHEQQAEAGQFDETVQHNATLAVAEATLALAEQQRIANLISLGMYTHADGSRGFQHLVCHPLDEYSLAINEDIRKGLGL